MMSKTKPDAGELNLDDIDSFTLLNAGCDIENKVLNAHTEKIVLSVCSLRLLSEPGEALDLQMELVAMLYKLKLSANPNVPTIFKGIGRSLGKYLTVECDFVVDMTKEQDTHETLVTKILTEGFTLYENGALSGVRLVNLLDQVRDMDYQDILTTAQEASEARYMSKIFDQKTYLDALDKISHL